jgi:hypothetical protein
LCVAAVSKGQEPHEQNTKTAAKKYSMVEYNDFTRAVRPENPEEQVKLLDAFVAKYPDTLLLGYAYGAYYKAYEKFGESSKSYGLRGEASTSSESLSRPESGSKATPKIRKTGNSIRSGRSI